MSERTYRIGVLPGDGIGPEVVRQGLKVLERVSGLGSFSYALVEYPWNSRLYLDSGRLMPPSELDEMRTLDAIYFGALGDPRVERGLIERSVLMAIRLGLDLYVNLRPVTLYADRLTPLKGVRTEDVDMVVVRENTEDAYVGVGGTIRAGTPQETAIAEMVYTRSGVERAIRYAFDLAATRRRRLTLVDKSNAIRPQEIWRRVFAEVGREYPDVQTDEMYVDAAAMYMVSNPARFDVIVTTNLFGDILTDLGAVIAGGLGLAASGNIHPGRTSLFEPIHGSAPDIAGRGTASPLGAILALAMMVEYLGEKEMAAVIEGSVRELLVSGAIPTADATSGLSTDEVGDMVVAAVDRRAAVKG